MNNNYGLKLTQSKIYILLFSLMLLALYLQNFYIELGFGLKPFMFVLAITILAYIVFEFKIIKGMYLYEKFFLLFFFYSIIRGYFSLYKVNYFRLVLGFTIVIIMYIVTTNLVYKINTKKLINIIYYISILFMLISLTLYFLGDKINNFGAELDKGIYRLRGTITDPNIFVVFCSLIYGLSLHKLVNKEKKYLISVLLAIICILLTFSRGGLLGIFWLTVFYIIKFKVINFKMFIKFVCIFIIILIVSIFVVEIMDFDVITIFKKRVSDISGSGRIRIWKQGIELFKNNPIFGIGLYNFRNYNINLYNDYHHLHNTFLGVLVENGIIGTILFSLFLISFVFHRGINDIGAVVKIIIYAQLIMFVFLTGIINEFLYFTFALYKGVNLKLFKQCKISFKDGEIK